MVSKPTVENFLKILSQTYVVHIISSYAKNLGNELKKSKKVYLFDIGIRNSILIDFRYADQRDDGGFLKESFVCLSIIKQLKPNMELKFWRTKQGHEIDFIVLKNRIPLPVEVKSALTSCSISAGMKKFLETYPEARTAIVFNDTIVEEIQYKERAIRFLHWSEAEDIEFLRDVV
jgi:hypothetical protein